MQRRNVRVLLASEHPQVRHFLREVVEGEPGAVIVGQAENAPRALTLARNLRPDVAVIDCYLPHIIGMDSMPLSRIGGLDTAQTTSEEIPSVKVVLLGNLDTRLLPQRASGPATATFSRDVKGSSVPFTLHELFGDAEAPGNLVFASVEPRVRTASVQKGASISDKAMLFGGLAMLAGWAMIITVFLAGVGVYLALAGAATMFLGVAAKLASRLWGSRQKSE